MSVRPSSTPDPDTFRVLIVEEDGRTLERGWPARVVLPLDLPVDPLALPPPSLPEAAARTMKSRFALHFLVRGPKAGDWQVVPTTSPRALGLGVLTGIVALFLRNMIVSGSPLAIAPRGVWLPPALPRPGMPAAQQRRISRQGPPPARPRPGRGRR